MPETNRVLYELAAGAGVQLRPLREGSPLHFRYRARLAVRGRKENPKIGIFELGTHRVVHIPNCPIHHPLINEVARSVRRALIDHRVLPYSELAHAGQVRYLQLVVERKSSRVQLVVVTNDREPAGLSAFFEDLASRLGERLQGLFWNGQPERSNSVIGPHWQHFGGESAVCEDFRGVKLFYPPGAFGQSHLTLAETIAERVADYVPEGAHVAEFYAGVGAIGLPLAGRCTSLVLNELGQDSLNGLARSIAELPAAIRERISVLPGDAAGAAAAVERRDVVIVDPPRKGIDAALLAKLVANPPARLLYVSCGLPSLVEQTKTLEQSFRLTALEPFALFPYTEHVETLAVFERR